MMRTYDVEQGSAQWLKLRLGIPTASSFHRIIPPKTLKLSGQSKAYMYELVSERLSGKPARDYQSEFMERGSLLEPVAIETYEEARGVKVNRVGFCTDIDAQFGCSPDGLVGDDGGLEIKCPSPAVHAEYLCGKHDAYKCQIQGGLLVTDRQWWDFMSYHPDMPPLIVRFERDEKFISALYTALVAFCGQLDEMMEHLTEKGLAT
jgi:hypothetical protein